MRSALKQYQHKRDFTRTPEPEPGSSDKQNPRASEQQFVVQKHAASSLHYDFRLQVGSVLKSWAVPKGPSLDPGQKRLAIHVEDHPVPYADFEGVIPKGEYGGGTVMLWDRGTWHADSDPAKALEKGHFTFELHGQRLNGRFTLIRTPSTSKHNGKRKSHWLLIKVDDEFADADDGILESHNTSIETGRTMREIAADPLAHWSRNNGHAVHVEPPADPVDPESLTNARQSKQPAALAPQLATLVQTAPLGTDWLHEVKFDGYRMLTVIRDSKVALITRQGKDWTHRFKPIAQALKSLNITQAILDGEIIAPAEDGRSDFQRLQNHLNAQDQTHLAYYLFDVPHFEGFNLTRAPLMERKELLHQILKTRGADVAATLRYSDHIVGQGEHVHERACEMHLEGVISKRADSPYRSRRTKDWLKSKCVREQEFIIVGYSRPGGSRTGFGALLLAYHDDDDQLRYCGRVGTGFTEQSLSDLHDRLTARRVDAPAITDDLPSALTRGVTWVKPELIAQVAFQQWTADGRLRHPVFQGLREDKEPKAITREKVDSLIEISTSQSVQSNAIMETSSNHASNGKLPNVRLTSPDRVLYPEQGITKRELALYYNQVASHILPHLRDRPLAIVRCPQGRAKQCFFQKHFRDDLPEHVTFVETVEDGHPQTWISISDARGLVSLAQIGVLEIHPWAARVDRIERPDRLIIDLDPGDDVHWEHVVELAHAMRKRLADLELESFVKTTGGKGLHIFVPLTRLATWEEVKSFAKALADELARKSPKRYIATMTKSRRRGRVYIDYLRNGRGATCAAAYSPRARAGATVSTPLAWSELSADRRNEHFNVKTVPIRLSRLKADPWEGFGAIRQSISQARLKALNV